MMTSEHLQIQEKSTSFRVDFLARIFRGQTQKPKELKDTVQDCGAKCTGLWGRLDLTTSSLKTVQTSLFEDLNESYATFPKSGMMRSGNVYQLQPLDSNIEGNEYTLLPTPTHTVSFQIGWETPLLMWKGIKTRKSGVKYGVNFRMDFKEMVISCAIAKGWALRERRNVRTSGGSISIVGNGIAYNVAVFVE